MKNKDLKEKIEAVNWDFIEANGSNSVNSIHPYPAKFISEIPKKIIEIFPLEGNLGILDPFCGSGTTLSVAQDNNIPSVGIDLNPIACLISKVKTQSLPAYFIQCIDIVINEAQNNESTDIRAKIQNIDHWFKLDVQIALDSLIYEINKIEDVRCREALRLAFSSIVVRVSNQESDTRYAAIENNICKEDVYRLFRNSCNKIYSYLNSEVFSPEIEAQIINQDILKLNIEDINFKIGMVITSPPYPNAYEYWLYHKFRISWLGFDPKDVKENEIGTRSRYFKKNHETIEDFLGQMRIIYKKLKEIVVPGGLICIIVGRSRIHGVEYDNGELLKKLAEEENLEYVTTVTRIINSKRKSFNLKHAKIKDETLLFLKIKEEL